MPKLPDTYWQRSQFIKPLDRDVVCHASAWDMNMGGEANQNIGADVRTKMCIQPTEEDFTTIYHELGHLYYDLAYKPLPPLFQNGANDGFHEAIGDTIVLAMTPKYLQSIGMVGEQRTGREALINWQMRMALSKVAFLPFGLMIDRWRWGVFDGSITPEHYNQAWWELKAKYQGVAPVSARGEDFFDPGAKYHVPGNTPYTRYFLAHILQFQFYKSLCQAAGHQGPLYECSFYRNKDAGQKFWSMLQRGSSQPWQTTLKELTGNDKLDAGPMLEYFAPMSEWLKQQNQGRCVGGRQRLPLQLARQLRLLRRADTRCSPLCHCRLAQQHNLLSLNALLQQAQLSLAPPCNRSLNLVLNCSNSMPSARASAWAASLRASE